ncbi:hypothetical protein [Bradyrhizobium sp. USDA 4508]
MLIELKRSNESTIKAQAQFEMMRKDQLDREQRRQRLLSVLHP